MIADTSIQQSMETNGQSLVTTTERQNLIQQLSHTWTLQLATKVENLAYEKTRGIKPHYYKMAQSYNQQLHNTNQRRLNQQQQQQQQQQSSVNPTPPPPPSAAPLNNNNNGQYLNQQMNFSQTSSTSMSNVPIINPQSRFSIGQQARLPNSHSGMISNQPSLLNQNLRLREPQNLNQPIHYPSLTNDLSQTYSSSPSMNTSTLNDYLSSTSIPTNRFQNNSRQRTTSLNANFSQQTTTTTTNSNDILHQFVVGNPPPTNVIPTATATHPPLLSTTANVSSSGDRLLQQILLSDNTGLANKTPIQHRSLTKTAATAAAPIMPSQVRPSISSTTNLTSLRPSLPPQPQVSPIPPVAIHMPTSNNSMQSSPNVSIQASPSNNSNPTSIPMNTDTSTPLTNRSGPSTDSIENLVNGQISSPDEETRNLIKYLKENLNRTQHLCQRFTTEGHLEKARSIQNLHQQMTQFITNPTYETLSNAKQLRDILERIFNRTQPMNSSTTTTTTTTAPQINEMNLFEKVLQEFISRDTTKSLVLTKLFIEPLSDVINGVPHKKFRLDDDDHQYKQSLLFNQSSSLLNILNNELNSLLNNRFSIEYLSVSQSNHFDEEYLSKNGLVIGCKLLDKTNPIIPTLRIRISTRYPDEQPDILSLTKSLPPKLEYTDGHPFFEQLSTIFVSQLFRLPAKHTIADILHIWYQSVQMVL